MPEYAAFFYGDGEKSGLEDPKALQPLLKPAPSEDMEGYCVGYFTRDDTPELIERK